MRLRVLLILALLVSLPATAHGQPAFAGPEVFLGSRIAPSLPNLSVAPEPGGGFVAAWYDGSTLFARRVDARGVPRTGELRLGTGLSPAVASTGHGFVVVYGVPHAGISRGRRFDGAGRPLGKPFALGTPEQPVGGYPRVASDRQGNFVVAGTGTDQTTGQGEIFIRRFAADGTPRSGPLAMPRTPASAGWLRSSAAVFRRPEGEILVIWNEYILPGSAGTSRYLAQRLDRYGVPVGLPIRISTGFVSGDPAHAVFTPDGGFLTAWLGWAGAQPDADSFGFWGRAFDRSGRPRSAPFRISPAEDNGDLGSTGLATDGRGGYAAAWLNRVNGLRVRTVELSGPVGEPLDTGRLSPFLGLPLTLAGGSSGSILLVASRRVPDEILSSRGLIGQRLVIGGPPGVLRFARGHQVVPERGEVRIEVQRREGAGGAVRAEIVLAGRGAAPGRDVEPPATATVSFADGESVPQTVVLPLVEDRLPEADEVFRVSLASPAGGAVLGAPGAVRVEIRDDDIPSPLLAGAGEPRELDGTGGLEFHTPPRVVAAPTGNFMAVWDGVYNSSPFWSESVVEAVLCGPDGAILARKTPGQAAEGGRIAALPDGGFVLTSTWFVPGDEENPPEELGLFGQRFDAGGLPVGAPFELDWGAAEIAAGAGDSLIALRWELESSSPVEIVPWVRRLDLTGQPLGPPMRVPSAGQDGVEAALAAAPSGAFGVAWQGRGGADPALSVRLFSPNGRPRGAPLRVDASPRGFPGGPALAFAPDGGFVVAWSAFADGDGSGVFVRAFDAAGRPRTGEIQVNSDPAGAQTAPSVAVQTDGRFLVAWQSGFEGAITVHAQLFAPSGVRLGDALPLDPAGALPQLTPAVAAGPGGFAAVWHRWGYAPDFETRIAARMFR